MIFIFPKNLFFYIFLFKIIDYNNDIVYLSFFFG